MIHLSTRRYSGRVCAAAFFVYVASVGALMAQASSMAQDLAEPVMATIMPQNPDTKAVVEHIEQYQFNLIERGSPSEVLTFPCGTPFPLPTGTFLGWAEGPGELSRLMLLRYQPTKTVAAPHRFWVAVYPAGEVRVEDLTGSAKRGDRKELEVRLIEANPVFEGKLQRGFARRLPYSEIDKPHQMPVGPVISAVYDTASDSYLGLSRPVTASSNKTVLARTTAPAKGKASLVVRVERGAQVIDPKEDDVQVTLRRTDGSVVPPAETVRSAERIYCFWYDIPPGEGTVEVTSSIWWAEPTKVTLSAAQIGSLELRLEPAASLHASIVLPDDAAQAPGALSVLSEGGGVTYRSVGLKDGIPADVTVGGLPRLPVQVRLDFGPWKYVERVDLRPGDATVVLAPDFVHVTGQVTVEDKGVPAKVQFLTVKATAAKEVASEHSTDEEGRFAADLVGNQVQPILLVSVQGREPIWWNVEPPLHDGQVIDINLKGRAIDLKVVDAETGDGVEGAEVWYGWAGESAGGRRASSDSDGLVHLPPAPEADLRVGVRADGYVPATRLIDLENTTDEQVTVPIEKERKGKAVTLLLPGGGPASGAEVGILTSTAMPPSWVGHADGAGTVRLPESADSGVLAARHPQAGVLLADLNMVTDDSTTTLALPASGGALAAAVVDPSGKPAPYAVAVAWIGGYRLSGGGLAWLLKAPGMSLADGSWSAQFLPAQPIALLFCDRSGDAAEGLAACAGGQFDYRRENIAYPWSGVVQVEAVMP